MAVVSLITLGIKQATEIAIKIAEKLNMPESTSRSTLTRARGLLWQLYKNEITSHESRRIWQQIKW